VKGKTKIPDSFRSETLDILKQEVPAVVSAEATLEHLRVLPVYPTP